MRFISDKEYRVAQSASETEERIDPFMYMRQRSSAWHTAGSVFSSLLGGWLVWKAVSLILVGTFLFLAAMHVFCTMF